MLDEWRLVTAWCRRCWWKRDGQFHPAAGRRSIQQYFDRLHSSEAERCPARRRHVNLESAPPDPAAAVLTGEQHG